MESWNWWVTSLIIAATNFQSLFCGGNEEFFKLLKIDDQKKSKHFHNREKIRILLESVQNGETVSQGAHFLRHDDICGHRQLSLSSPWN